MSTRIIAYKYKSTMDQLMVDLWNLRKKYSKESVLHFRSQIHNYEDSKPFIEDVRREMSSEHSRWDDLFNMKAGVVVYPFEGQIYLQVFGENDFDLTTNATFIKDWMSGRLEDFHYQNSSDPWYDLEDFAKQKTIKDRKKYKRAEKDWENRKRIWDEIFKDGRHSPSSAGLNYEFLTTFDAVLAAGEAWRGRADI